jgi:hypothetical protein
MRTYRNSLILLATCLIAASCGTVSQASRAEREAERQMLVQAIEAGNFVLDITQIIPRGYPSRSSTGEYALRLKDGVVDTRLPYLGDSRTPTYGGVDEISIVFDSEKVALRKDFSDAGKGEYRYQFQGGKGQDTWTVNLQLYDNGRANIGCSSRSGRYMSYLANILVPVDEKK